MTPIIIDLVVGLVILLSTVIAAMRGFIREILTILGLLGSLAVTWVWGGVLKPTYSDFLTSWAESQLDEVSTEPVTHLSIWKLDLPIEVLATLSSYGTLFLISFIAMALLNFYVSSLVQDSDLSTVDRSFGALFGLVRGVILVVLLYMPLTLFIGDDGEKPKFIAEAKTVPLLDYSASFVQNNILPEKNETDENIDNNEKNKKIGIKEIIENGYNSKALKDKKDGYAGDDRVELDQIIQNVFEKDSQ